MHEAGLQEIAKMLQQEPSLKVPIVGHTDSDGSFEMNMELLRHSSASTLWRRRAWRLTA